MGCDIHFRVEYLEEPETVAVKDGAITVVPEAEGPRWRPAERLTPDEWYERVAGWLALPLKERPKGTSSGEPYSDELLKEWLAEQPAMTIAREDRFYAGRDYRLFWKLSGVRGDYDNIEPMSDGNGLPDDVSDEIGEDLSEDDLDLHSHTHYTLTELLEEDWKEFDRENHSNFYPTVLQMEALAIERCGGDTDRVRAVFAYDN